MSPLVQIRHVKKYFFCKRQELRAVDDVSLDIFPKETLGLVGESGCGKTTLARVLMHLYKPTHGEILFDGENIQTGTRKKAKTLRHNMQYIFQDPYSSLNPRMTVGEIIAEPLHIHSVLHPKKRKERVHELLHLVGLRSEYSKRFPHEFSGGQCQRIGIARALALNPRFIVCDEPVAALDVSIQSQIINLLKKLQKEMELTYLFISHGLSIVKYLSTRVAVMYLGCLMELASSTELYEKPLHPYTQGLLSAVLVPDPQVERKRTHMLIKGELPSLLNPPKGCVFCTRCIKAKPICHQKRPLWKEVSPGHVVACHLYYTDMTKQME